MEIKKIVLTNCVNHKVGHREYKKNRFQFQVWYISILSLRLCLDVETECYIIIDKGYAFYNESNVYAVYIRKSWQNDLRPVNFHFDIIYMLYKITIFYTNKPSIFIIRSFPSDSKTSYNFSCIVYTVEVVQWKYV